MLEWRQQITIGAHHTRTHTHTHTHTPDPVGVAGHRRGDEVGAVVVIGLGTPQAKGGVQSKGHSDCPVTCGCSPLWFVVEPSEYNNLKQKKKTTKKNF